MLNQLLLSKRLFTEGVTFSRRPDAVSCGLAISLFQDAVELFVWAIIKERNISVKDTSSFTANLEAVEKYGIDLADKAKIQELNKARVGFKHYGNLPAPDEARKFQTYAEDFLRSGMQDHFSRNFDSVSLVDLVSFPDVREHLKNAESAISSGDLENAVRETAIAKSLLFSRLERHIPEVDRSLNSLDAELAHATQTRGLSGFKYLASYLNLLRDISLITLLRVPLADYTFLRTHLPMATNLGGGNWQTVYIRSVQPDETHCRRSIGILVDASVRLEGVV
jgi:hypothetical protein